jgi:hypothetical protein
MKRKVDPDSAVCIATRYELDDPGIEVGARFSAPVLTGPVPHRVSYKMGTAGKAAGAWRSPPTPY